MSEAFRALCYPYLGFLATFFFSSRFFYQWIKSEKKGKSHVTKGFWNLSLAGHLFMMLHTFVQLQFPFCLIQTVNALIAVRNIQFFHPNKTRRSTRNFLKLCLLAVGLLTLAFMLQSYVSYGFFKWVRTPSHAFNNFSQEKLSIVWHICGFVGATLFASRFWIQIIRSHQLQQSVLGKNFWILSLIGSLCTCIYAIRMQDIVNIIGYSVGIIPYIRNLALLMKNEK